MGNYDKPNALLVILSVLLPIVGYVLYFVKRNESSAASSYLYAALGGSVIGLILTLG